MSQDLAEVERKASQLSGAERAQLALHLLESLEPLEGGDVQEDWRIEAESRLAQIECGKARLVPADEVFNNLRRRPD